jgi:hypothetical protein
MKLQITAKCDDRCSVNAGDLQSQGYVPRNLGIGGGDYIRLTIDTETGKVEGWKPLTQEALTDAFETT